MRTLYAPLLLSLTTCHSLVVPELTSLAPRLHGASLDYRVAIGSTENPFQMQGLQVELASSKLGEPKIASTGLYDTRPLEKRPYYVNSKGIQAVELKNGCWEVNWKKNSAHGFFICSFEAPESVQRNDEGATLEAGRFYIYHRVWSKQTLQRERGRRKAIQAKAQKHLWDRDQLVKKLQGGEGNVLTKMKSYGQAVDAMNKFRDSGLVGARFTPLFDDQVLELAPDCILSTRGRVFRKAEWQKDFFVRAEDLIFMGEEEGKKMAYIGESRVDFSNTGQK